MKTVGAIVAVSGVFTAIGGIFAMVKTFLIIGLIAAVVIVVWMRVRRARRD